MTIKLVATDMDGTFLTDEKHFDKPRFTRIYDYMIQNHITFVSASGNQYYQLKDFFKDFPETLFVAENGALIGNHQEIYRTDTFSPVIAEKTIKVLNSLPAIQTVMCGEKSAYILKDVTKEFYKMSNFYFPHIQTVDSLFGIEDNILKFSVSCPKTETEKYMDKLADMIGDEVSIVTSGHGDIDVIRADVNKSTGLQYLSEKLNIQPSEMCAFGDGGNDLEMLRYVGRGVAMENGSPIVKQTAQYQTINNNQQGVLHHLEELFQL
ncbi:Cof-type HAD-IIB family hydrolase [Companilactobacillus halodurans]|uniref:HAD family hydrolase n=1 Tax=Companilactobacillus halodurans TaxID=2584183 RepID=A0A5P0ZZM8_9LACO|nr:Cof-type HAD-IIB family hydrolase [Companilactobacillus halodurans]MQS98194.1 HAD family hydrolase [Companilactobacillus halodurans]